MATQPRWSAEITYRVDAGSISTSVELVELSDIEQYIERGPHWDTVEKIEIVRINHCDSATLTIEQAEKL